MQREGGLGSSSSVLRRRPCRGRLAGPFGRGDKERKLWTSWVISKSGVVSSVRRGEGWGVRLRQRALVSETRSAA